MKLTRKRIITTIMLLIFLGSIIIGVADLLLKEPEVKKIVVLDTSLGSIEIELNGSKAPRTVDNFVAYVEQGFYNGLVFHRVIRDFVIQGGGFEPDGTWRTPTRNPVISEARNGLKNVKGALGMARSADPDSATSQFYINTVDNSNLDYPNPDGYGYTVFGKVVKGMEVVEEIAASPTDENGWPNENIVIIRAYMKES